MLNTREEKAEERKRRLTTEEQVKPKKKATAKQLVGAGLPMLSAPLWTGMRNQ